MRLRLLALACAIALPASVSAEPVSPFTRFIFGTQAVVPVSAQAPSSSVRPAPRPEVTQVPVRTVGVTRRITRLPWTTGVFQ
jgi:hypothetical protein